MQKLHTVNRLGLGNKAKFDDDKKEILGVEKTLNVKYPILILQGTHRKGKNENKTGVANDLLYKNYPENEIGFKKLFKEIYKLENQKLVLEKYNQETANKAAKLFAEQRILKINEFAKKNNTELFKIFKDDAELYFSKGKLQENIDLMITHMQQNKGGAYSNSNLTKAVLNHVNSISFIKGVSYILANYLEENKGNVKKLEIVDDTEGILYDVLGKAGIKKPTFNTISDLTDGLQIAINDLWTYQVRITKFTRVRNKYEIELEFMYYDHFGLDYPDIHKFNNDIFMAWFVLQHFRGFKPFITEIALKSNLSVVF